MIYSVSGLGGVKLDAVDREEWLSLSAGQFLIIDDDKLKAIRADQQWQLYWFDFALTSPLYLPEGEALTPPDGVLSRPAFDAIAEALGSDCLWTRRHSTALFCSLLTGLVAGSKVLPSEEDPAVLIQRVLDHLKGHLDQLISVDEMAEIAGMSVNVFRKKFAEVMGALPKTVYDRVRMDAAQSLLAQGLTVSETAHRLGYKDAFHFSRAFRRVRGIPPREIQKRLKPSSEKT